MKQTFPKATTIVTKISTPAIKARVTDVIIEIFELEGSRRCMSADYIIAVDEQDRALVVKSNNPDYPKGSECAGSEIELV